MTWKIRKQNIIVSLGLMLAFLALPVGVQAVVVGESHPNAEEMVEENPTNTCVYFLDAYLHPINSVNHEWEVRKLQMFLNAFIGSNLTVTGNFDAPTEAAARQFQLVYNDQILVPWAQAGYDVGPFDPTGYVYITTRHMINELLCVTSNIPLPALTPDSNIMNGTIN